MEGETIMVLRRKPTSPEAFIEAANSLDSTESLKRIQQLEEELAEKQQQSQSLVSEIDQLRSRTLDETEKTQLQLQIDELRDQLKKTQGETDYPISRIRRNEHQPRQTFDVEVAAMILSLEREGQLDPVMIFDDGTLFDGECRWRAAFQIGWKTLKTVFVPRPDDRTIRRRAYLTSLHRQSLNPLDRAEALVAIACDHVEGISAVEVPRIVSRVQKRIKRKGLSLDSELHRQSVDVQQASLLALKSEGIDISDTEASVFLVLLGLQEHPMSLERNVFNTLNLTSDLKDAVRQQRLGCSQAMILNGLTAERLKITERRALSLRQKGVKMVVEQSLTDAQTKQWVAEQKHRLVSPDGDAPVRHVEADRFIKSMNNFDWEETVPSMTVEQRQELRHRLELLLEHLNSREPS